MRVENKMYFSQKSIYINKFFLTINSIMHEIKYGEYNHSERYCVGDISHPHSNNNTNN